MPTELLHQRPDQGLGLAGPGLRSTAGKGRHSCEHGISWFSLTFSMYDLLGITSPSCVRILTSVVLGVLGSVIIGRGGAIRACSRSVGVTFRTIATIRIGVVALVGAAVVITITALSSMTPIAAAAAATVPPVTSTTTVAAMIVMVTAMTSVVSMTSMSMLARRASFELLVLLSDIGNQILAQFLGLFNHFIIGTTVIVSARTLMQSSEQHT